jgi:hypothetical protein
MFDKPLPEVTLADIQQLVDVTKEPEGQLVDYKRQLETSNDGKRELLKDITAFANAEGGYLIVGVDESNGIPTTITGTPSNIGRQRLDEWVSSLVSTNTDPKVSYESHAIPYQSGKIILIIRVKPSPKKPHMVTHDKRNTYFRRHQDIVLAATHQEVRDMFAESQATVDRLRSFLQQRNLLDENETDFGRTRNYLHLVNDRVEEAGEALPACIMSLIPRVLPDDLLDPVSGPARQWINNNTRGYEPIPSKELFRTHEGIIDIEGVTFAEKLYGREGPLGFKHYVQFLRNGYVEAGLSRDLFYDVDPHRRSGQGQRSPMPAMNLTNAVALAHATVNLANKYYPSIHYEDDVFLQISVRNVRGYALGGFDERQPADGSTGGWAEPYGSRFDEPPTIRNYDHFKVVKVLTPNGQNEPVNDLVFDIATQISRAFGVEIIKCFDDARTYSPTVLSYLSR